MEHPEEEVAGVVRSLCQGSPQEQYKAVQEYFLPDASFVHPFCQVPSISDIEVPGLGTINSRTVILAIFKWYKILSPKIVLEIESTAYDDRANKLYLGISQTFDVWFIPFYRASVHLTTVLHLVHCRVSDEGRILGRQDEAASSNDNTNGSQHNGPTYAEVAAAPPLNSTGKERVSSPDVSDETTPPPDPGRFLIAKQEDLYQVNEFLKFILPGIGAPAWAMWQILSTAMCVFGVLACWPVLVLLDRTGLFEVRAAKGDKAARDDDHIH